VNRRLGNRAGDAVFLCYHSVAEEGPTFLTVKRDLFERQLDEVERRGMRTGGLEELARLAAGEEIGATVFITFDDGFLNNYETVLPILRERGMRAFVFVLPPLVDSAAPLVWPEVAADAERYPAEMRSVSWEMLDQMSADGTFTVGAHTLTHPSLPRLEGAALSEEIAASGRLVRERLGSCETFAYPFGHWNEAARDAVAAAGFRFAFTLPTTHGQRRADPLTIPRVNVDYRDDGRRFAAKLGPFFRRAYLSPELKGLRRGAGSLKRLR
jgi:peptidoglycan/xylan/chitin deacetylase (PgdA/CDA1 family)